MKIARTFKFDAAHKLGKDKCYGKCQSLHGHTWHFTVEVEGPIINKGWVINFKDLEAIVNRVIINKLDHTYLNQQIRGLLPTAENLSKWMFRKIKKALPKALNVTKIILYESPDSYAICEKEDL